MSYFICLERLYFCLFSLIYSSFPFFCLNFELITFSVLFLMIFWIYFSTSISFWLKNLVALALFFRLFSFDHIFFIFFLWFVVIFHLFPLFWSLNCEVILCCLIFFLFRITLLIFTNFREQILTKCSCPLLFQGLEIAEPWSVLHCFMGIKVFRNSVIQYISALNIFLDLEVATLTEFILIATLSLS